jgi:YebC/PmpR family DNA-binding regulatory protein
MAGHSHWKSIKHQKAAQDAKKSKYFSKFSKAIMIAARDGGGEPESNLKLQYAIDKARAGNMPRDAIEKAIKKGTGELQDASAFEEISYEGYAPGGVAVIAEALTDNKNRSASEIRKIFENRGGKLGARGSVTYLFERKGILAVLKKAISEEALFELAVEAGAEDVQALDEVFEVTTPPHAFVSVKNALLGKGLELEVAELAFVAVSSVTPQDARDQQRVETLLSELEDYDDIQAVHSNYAPPG